MRSRTVKIFWIATGVMLIFLLAVQVGRGVLDYKRMPAFARHTKNLAKDATTLNVERLAEKIVLELKEKMAGRGVTVDAPELKEEADALEALVSLGYSQKEAREALAQVPAEITSVEKRVREVLKKIIVFYHRNGIKK